MLKYVLTGALLLAVATPALAAEFYVVRDSATKKCTVVDKRPTLSTLTVVGNSAYKTQAEADLAVKKICI
jgi:hypothetical protein